jgi:hypothetical protein
MNHKLILKTAYIVVNLILLFGFVLPFLISYDSDTLVLLGMVIGFCDIYHIIYFTINLIKSNKTE